ncbi:protein Smaug [Episyrphus balteatus]|uniref:protein Smaug n=1 Tax=Episyrphus balteatus TaxID=286459 RepID=UPI0024850764|nr:protein Smaug [Episyrphus balteatus]XP_055844951.1 protein Smaug [Episyrphus balteatus]
MKFSSGSSTAVFSEQVSTVASLFDKWSDCERTVVIYALIKRMRYPSLRFLQYSLENSLTLNAGLYNGMPTFDINANSPLYLETLINAYKSLPSNDSTDNTDKDAMYFGSDFMFKNDGKLYNKKEDILNEILEILPLLKPGSDEAKAIYLSLIPLAVEDTGREIVSTELVQQIFSYLLIHPAISNDDRRSLNHWLRNLEEIIQTSCASAGQHSFYGLSNNTDRCSTNSTASVSSSVGSVTSKNAWQAIAPPQQSNKAQLQSQQPVSDTPDWNVSLPTISNNLCDNFSGIKINELGSSQNSLGLSIGGAVGGVSINSAANTTPEDHHTSFSRNGTEIIDFDSNNTCESCSCAQVGYPSSLNTCDNFNENSWGLDGKIACMKTRRSNSLTTAISSFASANPLVTAVSGDNCSNSSENLAQYALKPRSFSLSIENPRSSMISSDSDSRLDDIKPNYLKFSTPNSGMSNIGQWLKSLRLHKYIELFKNITYESMLEITEEYLQELGVTKGASHKLALCIEKLKDREIHLTRIEQELLNGQLKLNQAIEELAGIVLTPMKPVDSVLENVAFKFLRVIDLISSAILQKDACGQLDEENISILLWILERTIHGETFATHVNQLKELKFKIAKLKISFAPKVHHLKSSSSSNLSKPRWNCKGRKTDQKNGSSDKINRKNSTDINFQQQLQVGTQRTSASTSNSAGGSSNNQYKSSSYPNFISGSSIPVQSFHHSKPQISQQSMFVNQTSFVPTSTNQQQQQQHRRSLNNLVVVSSSGHGSLSPSTAIGSPMSPKPNEGKNRKSMANRNQQQSVDMQPKPTTSSNVAVKKPTMEKTMAAVVLENLAKLDQHCKK